MAGFGTSIQGVPGFQISTPQPVSPSGFVGAQVHGQIASEPGVSAYSSVTKPLVLDPTYAAFNKDAISGTQAPCSFSGRGAPVCGSQADIKGSVNKAERIAKERAPMIILAVGAIIGFFLLRGN